MKLIIDNKNSEDCKRNMFVLTIIIEVDDKKEPIHIYEFEFPIKDEWLIKSMPNVIYILECLINACVNTSMEYEKLPEYQAFFIMSEDCKLTEEEYKKINPTGYKFDNDFHCYGFLNSYELHYYCQRGRKFSVEPEFNEIELKRFKEISEL
jgi:hypothetical protein